MPPSSTKLDTKYAPQDHEPRVLDRWAASRAFHADPRRVLSGEREPYCILIPPPNVTARLHLGHALVNTLQDVLTRAHRMKGYETLWMPGTDHAGIATQTVVDKRLKAAGEKSLIHYKRIEAEGRDGREAFVEKVQHWKDDYERQITDQLRSIGASCDWERQRFTMDEICARAVREAFFQLFKDGLIYRGKRLVNWDPITQTALADDEVEMEEIEGSFSYMRYPLRHTTGPAADQPVTWSELFTRGYPRHLVPDGPGVDGDDFAFVTVATTRPETYLGDTGVAVHPDDPRAGALDGLVAEIPLAGRRVPIVRDDYVVMPGFVTGEDSTDPKAKMATGFLKVTPAHDPNDWEIGRRHDLDVINVMAPDAAISDKHGWDDVGDAHIFVGLSREDAREKVVDEFRARGLLEKRVPYAHSVGHSYRSHVPVEPYLSDQWYCKVSDDRLVGAAQRALAPEQRTKDSLGGTGLRPVRSDLYTKRTFAAFAPPNFEPRDPYPDGQPVPADLMGSIRNLPHLELPGATYFVTWRTSKGEFSPAERDIVAAALQQWHNERCQVYALCVMPDHVHAIVRPFPGVALGDWVASVKKHTAQKINKSRGVSGPLWQDERFDHIVRDEIWFEALLRYVLNNPVEAGHVDHPSAYRWVMVQDGVQVVLHKHRSETGATQKPSGDGALRFSPARYAKTYESWHDGLRDWCISRQLWWGHRIPVWSAQVDIPGGSHPQDGVVGAAGLDHLARGEYEHGAIRVNSLDGSERPISVLNEVSDDHRSYMVHVCYDGRQPIDESRLEQHGFTQDADVLDTWFSSALWPLSTMGWPEHDLPVVAPAQIDPDEPDAVSAVWVKRVRTWKQFIGSEGDESGELIDRLLHLRDSATTADGDQPLAYQLFREADLRARGDDAAPLNEPDDIQRADDLVCAVGVKAEAPVESIRYGGIDIEALLLRHGFQNTPGLLDAFNPTSVLCTGRDIITLWVSRMVMFNRYFKGGDLPFRDVYINPIVQDGHGQRMSKSLGNGVDPLDIVHSHGADALRLVLCQIATSTQDVRMPVDTVCPHTGEVFEPTTTTTPNGAVVAAPVQTCPSDPTKSMVTAYGVASGLAQTTDETPLARNTSSRFDVGRNICTKLWNAARFAMMTLEEAGATSSDAVRTGELALVDRWMLSRLARAVAEIDEAIETYQFSKYAELVYDLLWRDFCDWYLEAIKPTVRTNTAQQAVLHAALDVILRVLHPITPFVTEVLFEHLQKLPRVGAVPGLRLEGGELLCTAPWPEASAELVDDASESRFGEAQALVESIRALRAAQSVPNRQKLTLHAPDAVAGLASDASPVVEHLAGLEGITTDDPEGASIELLHEGRSLRLSGLDEGVDPEKLKAQLADRKKKLAGEIKGLEGRLNNPGYVQKAPAHLVDETRGQLASKQAELADIDARLQELA